ncbi:hypothetical protein ES288_D02G201100v1 [Gossypium darwinii]|uniref:Uncharacterized protein n=1 Tax=Gossypium darwinii TaxID=34276 RepID=A0A5D2DEI9_GOSDA|nr:hypothetical protein ES288_D02G201100v1 [Gossypium darwinii]
MAKISDNELNAVTRRIVTVSNHFLLPIGSGSNSGLTRGSIGLCNASMDDSYHRIHGEVASHEFTDIIYEKAIGEGIAKITINRPERRNAFRPQTIKELIRAFNDARDDSSIGVIILTGKGTKAFCSGGDQALRKADGYADFENFGRLNVLDLQVQIRRLPKPVIAMVAGYAVGGGHVLHMVCDLTIAADNAIFGQTGPKVLTNDIFCCSSFVVGPKKAREMWFLARFYTASEAEKMGLVNAVVPCREILRNSPTAIRVLKAALNAVDDGHAGLQLVEMRHSYFMELKKGTRGKQHMWSVDAQISQNFQGDRKVEDWVDSNGFYFAVYHITFIHFQRKLALLFNAPCFVTCKTISSAGF